MIKLDIVIAVLVFFALAMLVDVYFGVVDGKILVEVQTGKKELWCHMTDGYRQIEASKINGFDSSRWYFSRGGSAKACKVI